MQHETRLFREICQEIVQYCKPANKNSMLNYAISYAKQGLNCHNWSEAGCQAVYLLSNLQYWRGGKAQNIKTRLSHLVDCYYNK